MFQIMFLAIGTCLLAITGCAYWVFANIRRRRREMRRMEWRQRVQTNWDNMPKSLPTSKDS